LAGFLVFGARIADEATVLANMTRKQFLQDMDKLVELPRGTLKGPERLNDIEQWNSMAMIGFIALADTVARASLSVSEILSCSTVSDLLRVAGIDC
jgi:acyl carrier protein